jgi:hypothetical protein
VEDSRRLGFVDLMDGTFRAIARTWITALVVGGVLFAPVAWIFSMAYGELFRSYELLADASAVDGESAAFALLGRVGGAYLLMFAAAVAQMLIALFVRACVTVHAFGVLTDSPAGLRGVLIAAAKRYMTLIGQQILLTLMYVGIYFAGFLVVAISLTVAFGVESARVAAIAFTVLFVTGLIVLFAWLAVRFAVVREAVVIDGEGVVESFGRSASIVKGAWWRVLGYRILLTLMVGFSIALVTTPLFLFASLGSYAEVLGAFSSDLGTSTQGETFLRALTGLSRSVALTSYAGNLLACVVTPVFMTLLYLGLKGWKPRSETPAQPVKEAEKGPLPT